MDAYQAGATGSNVLQKTRELKKSHRVPLVIDQPARVPYDRSRGERVLRNEDEPVESEEIVFDQEIFAQKICQLGYQNNPRRRFVRMGHLFRVRTREAPRADFLEGLGGKLYFDKLVEDHRWKAAMAEEWGDATVVTYDEEEWRALWKSNTYRPATNAVNEDEDEGDIDDI